METKAVLFDLDGTLTNTLADLRQALNHTLNQYGYPGRTATDVRAFVGNGLGKLLSRSLNQGEKTPEYQKMLAELKTYYAAHCLDETKPYPGIMELLNELKQRHIRMAVLSNKPDGQVKTIARHFFDGYMDEAIGERTGIRRKPAPDALLAAVKELGLTIQQCVYVGDSEVDIETANNARMRCISVAWGFRDETFLKTQGAQIIIHQPGEIIQYLDSEEIKDD